MTEYAHSDLKLYGKHLPDYSLEEDADGTKRRVDLPGKYQIGVEVEGVFVPLVERKAAGLFADIERAKNSSSSEG
jgi:hypothetical protein